MTNPNLTEIICILDRSGSMGPIRDDSIGGFNTFLEEQKQIPGEALLTLVLFNEDYKVVYRSVPISEARPLTREDFVPGGSTALLDAIGKTIIATGERLAAMPEDKRPGKVLVGILTDGEENASREFSRSKIFDTITHQRERYAWEFAFLAVGQDAFAEAGRIGISKAMTVQFNSPKEYGSGSHMKFSAITRSYRTGNFAS